MVTAGFKVGIIKGNEDKLDGIITPKAKVDTCSIILGTLMYKLQHTVYGL